MKKVLICFSFILCFVFAGNVKAAASTSVVVDVQGKMEAGENINIIINVNNIDSFYAGAASFKYDPNILKVLDIQKGSFILNKNFNTYDVSNKIDNTKGIANFGGFTCLGNVKGYSGSGTIIIIKAQLLKKESFHIKSQPFLTAPNDDYNLKLQLCNSDVKEVSYDFTGYELKVAGSGKTEVTTPIVKATDSSSNPNPNPNTNTNTNTNTANASTSAGTNTSGSSSASNSKASSSSSNSSIGSGNSSKSSSSTKNSTGTSSGTTSGSTGNKNGKSPYMIGGIVFLLVVLVGGVGYFVRRKLKD